MWVPALVPLVPRVERECLTGFAVMRVLFVFFVRVPWQGSKHKPRTKGYMPSSLLAVMRG